MARAPGAADLEDGGHERLAVLRMHPRQTLSQIGSAPPASNRSGQGLRQRAEDGAGHEVADQVPRRDRRRVDAVEDRALAAR